MELATQGTFLLTHTRASHLLSMIKVATGVDNARATWVFILKRNDIFQESFDVMRDQT